MGRKDITPAFPVQGSMALVPDTAAMAITAWRFTAAGIWCDRRACDCPSTLDGDLPATIIDWWSFSSRISETADGAPAKALNLRKPHARPIRVCDHRYSANTASIP